MKSEASNNVPGARRRSVFFIVALAIPVLFFVLLEGALRLAGQRVEYPLFVSGAAGSGYLQANPEVIKRFFANADAAPTVSIETAFFLDDKPDDALRIFVQGGSSAAGFPYGYGASLAGMLEQRLRRTVTDRPVEVISTAMSAVNSYTLLDFADEIIARQPDAVLIYAGHNEYLGVLGVGSAMSSGWSPALTRLIQRLRSLAIYQLLERVISGGKAGGDAVQERGGTLMARIAGEKSIAYGSELYTRGLEQFRGNLSRLLARYQRAQVPVIVGLLASNEKDLSPFVGGPSAGTDVERWQTLLGSGIAAMQAGDLPQADTFLASAISMDDGAADAWFARARVKARANENALARPLYLGAKDRDALRFRAPEAFNNIIRELADEHGAIVVDIQQVLADASSNGIIGNEMMLEHVHPNLDGYFALADAYYDALLAAGIPGAAAALPDDVEARAQIPVSEVDRLFGEYKLQRILGDWPFVTPRIEPAIPRPTNAVENLAYQMYHQRIGWLQAMDQLQRHYTEAGNLAEHTRVALILADAVPFGVPQQFSAGTALIRSGRPAEALRYLERGVRFKPDDVNVLLALSHARVLSGQHDKARDSLERVLELEPGNTTATDALKTLTR